MKNLLSNTLLALVAFFVVFSVSIMFNANVRESLTLAALVPFIAAFIAWIARDCIRLYNAAVERENARGWEVLPNVHEPYRYNVDPATLIFMEATRCPETHVLAFNPIVPNVEATA